MGTLGDEVERRQREHTQGEPSLRVLIALTAQRLQDLMDDKYLGLSEEITGLRREILELRRPALLRRERVPRWLRRLWRWGRWARPFEYDEDGDE